MLHVQVISTTHPLYPQAVDLRSRVLLEPIGYSLDRFHAEFPGLEQRFDHIVAAIDHPSGKRVVGTVCLLPHFPERGVGKLMQMVVDPQRQREGIGRALIATLERRAFGEIGLNWLFCHARGDSVGFYIRMGWTIVGEPFLEAGISHFRMEFRPA